jgi:phenylpropionate dioxygenase-like ring-hydroxylating dioxygenase large terminal subunit
MSCPYHGWSYELDGTHVGLSDNESFPDLPVPRLGLRELPVIEENGLIWVTPSFDAPVPEPALGAVGSEIEALEFGDH